jgi:hypothetical protein
VVPAAGPVRSPGSSAHCGMTGRRLPTPAHRPRPAVRRRTARPQESRASTASMKSDKVELSGAELMAPFVSILWFSRPAHSRGGSAMRVIMPAVIAMFWASGMVTPDQSRASTEYTSETSMPAIRMSLADVSILLEHIKHYLAPIQGISPRGGNSRYCQKLGLSRGSGGFLDPILERGTGDEVSEERGGTVEHAPMLLRRNREFKDHRKAGDAAATALGLGGP